MKKHIILASLLLLAGATTLAQEPTTTGDSTHAASPTINKESNIIDGVVTVLEYANTPVTTNSYTIIGDSVVRHTEWSFTSTLHFYWGFHNWGSNMWNGLAGLSGANDLRTSFSSYQLELQNTFHPNKRWEMSIGVGWESDCYKFDNPYVGLDVDAATGTGNFFVGTSSDVAANESFAGDLANLNNWETRLVARYINIPVRVGYNFKGGDFGIGLSVIPGFNYNGKHTGMKYLMETESKDYERIDNGVEEFLNPFKCDIRLDINTDFVGIFVQVPTMPVIQNMGEKYFPFKIGFFL